MIGVELQTQMLELSDENFESEVLEGGRLALVFFWRPGCGPCLAMEPVIEEVAREFEGRAGIGKLDIFESPETAKKYKVPATPTIIIFKKGEAIERAIGARPKQALVDKLNSLLGV